MSIPIIGGIVDGAMEWGKAWTEGKVEQTKVKARQKTTQLVEEGESTRRAIAAEAGTKRALIDKNIRVMRRAAMIILLMPYAIGALIILGAYTVSLFTGGPADPDFSPLKLFWTEVVGETVKWWTVAIQSMFAFIWAGGEITNVSAQAGGAVMDHIKRLRESKERESKETRRAERERRNREREGRGEQPLSDDPDNDDDDEEDPIVRPGPPHGGR